MFRYCPKCNAEVLDPVQCSACQLVFKKYVELEELRKKMEKSEEEGRERRPEERDTLKTRRLAFPAAAMLAFILVHTFLKHVLVYLRVWAHELGHALMSWMSGVRATPMSFGNFGFTSNSGLERSLVVFLCYFFLLALLHSYARRNQSPFLRNLSLSLLVPAVFFTWISPEKRVEEYIIFAGFAGEMLLAALLIVAFYQHLPRRWHWHGFLRWPSLVLGFFILISSTKDWVGAHRRRSLSVFGENYSEEFGDLNRLIVDYDWSFEKFIYVYGSVCLLSWVAVLGCYMYFLLGRNEPRFPKRL